MRRMTPIRGRSDDMMIIRGVNFFPSQIEEQILKDKRLSPHYRLEIRREKNLDELTVVVEANAQAANREDQDAAANDLAVRIKSHAYIRASVRVVDPFEIERSEGKAKRIFDLRN